MFSLTTAGKGWLRSKVNLSETTTKHRCKHQSRSRRDLAELCYYICPITYDTTSTSLQSRFVNLPFMLKFTNHGIMIKQSKLRNKEYLRTCEVLELGLSHFAFYSMNTKSGRRQRFTQWTALLTRNLIRLSCCFAT